MAKELTITIETNTVVVIRGRSSGRMRCSQCRGESELLRVAPQCMNGDTAFAALQGLLGSGVVHYEEAGDGSTLICLNSLLAFFHDRRQSPGSSLRAINAKVEEI